MKWEDFGDKLNPCPKCGSTNLSSFESPCQDSYCCGLGNRIECLDCNNEIELFGELEDIIEQWNASA